MEAKHTPGPWEIEEDENDYLVGPPDTLVCLVDRHNQPKADARLIAAAPELLKACRVAEQMASIASDWNLDEVEIDGEMVSTYELGELFAAAIAKATGETG